MVPKIALSEFRTLLKEFFKINRYSETYNKITAIHNPPPQKKTLLANEKSKAFSLT